MNKNALPHAVGRLVGAIAISALFYGPAQAELLLHPTRIVFDEHNKTAQIDIANTGSETEVYRIRWVNLRMTETGELVNIDSAGENEQFADSLVSFSPRLITLAPRSAEVVRLRAHKPSDTSDGEYRSHLFFERVANEAKNSQIAALTANLPTVESVHIQVAALMSVTMPVIVRVGTAQVDVGIDDLTLHPATASDQPAAVSFKLTRRGPYSSYGNIALVFVSPNGAIQPLANIDGIALYTPNTQRLMRLALPPLPTDKGHLRVTYTLDPKRSKAPVTQAEVAVP